MGRKLKRKRTENSIPWTKKIATNEGTVEFNILFCSFENLPIFWKSLLLYCNTYGVISRYLKGKYFHL